jgi:hypothetical protein
VEAYPWILVLLFAAPALLVWRKAFVGYLVVVGGFLGWAWALILFWTSPGDFNAGGSIGPAMVAVATFTSLLGCSLRLLLRPLIQEITAGRTTALGALRAAACGFLMGTAAWVILSQVQNMSGKWLVVSVPSAFMAAAFFAVAGGIRSSVRERGEPRES